MHLTSYLERINFSNDIIQLNLLFQSANGHVTFGGERKIRIGGYRGSYSLEIFARKLLDASYNCSNEDS